MNQKIAQHLHLDTPKVSAKPFLRWAGGKKWLLKQLNDFLPIQGYNQYHEPFVGGGSTFFFLKPEKAYLSDLNTELIETYKAVQSQPNEVIYYLKKFKNSKEDYLKIRKQKFRNSIKSAAQFIYLNQTSFNGIYRVNLKGEYNVPYGYRYNHKFDFENILSASDALSNVSIASYDFFQSLDNVQENDLVFLDPPYTVAHNNNGFIQYNQKIFSLDDQHKLAELIKEIKRKKAYYILTNANHITVREIFDCGDPMIEISRASLVGGKGAKRGEYSEIIVTNTRS